LGLTYTRRQHQQQCIGCDNRRSNQLGRISRSPKFLRLQYNRVPFLYCQLWDCQLW
jgi:hypothetical protein